MNKQDAAKTALARYSPEDLRFILNHIINLSELRPITQEQICGEIIGAYKHEGLPSQIRKKKTDHRHMKALVPILRHTLCGQTRYLIADVTLEALPDGGLDLEQILLRAFTRARSRGLTGMWSIDPYAEAESRQNKYHARVILQALGFKSKRKHFAGEGYRRVWVPEFELTKHTDLEVRNELALLDAQMELAEESMPFYIPDADIQVDEVAGKL